VRDRLHDGYEIGVPHGGMWRVKFNGDFNGYGDDYGNAYAADAGAMQPGTHGMSHKISIRLGPYTGLVLSRAD
jgi:1,4-alpha-glucan branching enzyme